VKKTNHTFCNLIELLTLLTFSLLTKWWDSYFKIKKNKVTLQYTVKMCRLNRSKM